jgi:hypothetical protein
MTSSTDNQQLTSDIHRIRMELIEAVAAVISDDITDKTDLALVALQFLVGHMPSRHELPTRTDLEPVYGSRFPTGYVQPGKSAYLVEDIEPDPSHCGPDRLGWPGVHLVTYADGTRSIETDAFDLSASEAREVAAALLSAAARAESEEMTRG